MRQANARAAATFLDISSCRVHSKDVRPSAVSSIDPSPANIINKPNYMLVTTHIRRQFHLVRLYQTYAIKSILIEAKSNYTAMQQTTPYCSNVIDCIHDSCV